MLTETILLTINAGGKAHGGMKNNLAGRRKVNAKCLRLIGKEQTKIVWKAQELGITRQITRLN